MSYQRERDEFIARMSREGWGMDLIRATLRAATTLQRLAEAQCNGDWPADNGERTVKPCTRCAGLWAPSVLVRDQTAPRTGPEGKWIPLICPDCRTTERIQAAVATVAPAWRVRTQGDPRGYVVRLHAAGETEADLQTGRARTIGVPSRG